MMVGEWLGRNGCGGTAVEERLWRNGEACCMGIGVTGGKVVLKK